MSVSRQSRGYWTRVFEQRSVDIRPTERRSVRRDDGEKTDGKSNRIRVKDAGEEARADREDWTVVALFSVVVLAIFALMIWLASISPPADPNDMYFFMP